MTVCLKLTYFKNLFIYFLDYDFRNILLREVALWIDKSNGVNYFSFVDNLELPSSSKMSPRKQAPQSNSPGRI